MGAEKHRVIDIDGIQQRLTVQQLAGHYGIQLPESFGDSGEQRLACPCSDCSGASDTKSVSINLSDPMKRWKCHREGYGCGAQGRLVMLAYCFKHGRLPPSGKLTGEAFLDIARDLEALADGKPREQSPIPTKRNETRSDTQATLEQRQNVPLAESENENARKLTRLDEQLVIDLSELSPPASRYARRRPFLLAEETTREVRTGYMPGAAKSSLRHNWVFGVMDRQGDPLAWVGRNVKYEEDHAGWIDAGRHGREPAKYRFPNQSLFLRGLELYGQEWLDDPRFAESLQKYGLIVTEGFTDRIRLHQLGVMSVAMMSNRLTDEQAERLASYAEEVGHGRVGVMHDADDKGDEGAKETLWRMHEAGLDAYLVWSRRKFNGRFAERQPETLTEAEWNEIAETIERRPM